MRTSSSRLESGSINAEERCLPAGCVLVGRPDKHIDNVPTALVDQRGDRLPIQVIQPPADERALHVLGDGLVPKKAKCSPWGRDYLMVRRAN